jgi:hypothetical protein
MCGGPWATAADRQAFALLGAGLQAPAFNHQSEKIGAQSPEIWTARGWGYN